MSFRAFRPVVLALLPLVSLGASSASPVPSGPAPKIQLSCTPTTYTIANIPDAGAIVVPISVVVGQTAAQKVVVPLVALDDLTLVTGATSSIQGDRITLKDSQHTLVFSRSSTSVTLDGKPAAPVNELPLIWRGRLYIDVAVAQTFSGDPSDSNIAEISSIPKEPDGKPQPVPAECAPKLSAAQSAILASANLPFPKRATPTPWCESASLDGSDLNGLPLDYARKLALNVRAERELCNGNYAAAANDLTTLKPSEVADGTKLIDFQRRYVVAESLGGDPNLAQAMLAQISPLNGDTAKPMRALWAKDYCASIRGFVAEDSQRELSPDARTEYEAKGPDPALAQAATDACTGRVDAAIAAMTPLATYEGGLYGLILGSLYAQKSDWPHAASAWWSAASDYPSHQAPEFDTFDIFNPQALWMIYYYRSHMPH